MQKQASIRYECAVTQSPKRMTTKCQNGSHKNSVTLSPIMLLVLVCATFVIVCAYVNSMVGLFHPLHANKLLIDSDCDVICRCAAAFVSFIVFFRSLSLVAPCTLYARIENGRIEFYASCGKRIWIRQCCSDTDWLRFMKYVWIYRWWQRRRQHERHPNMRCNENSKNWNRSVTQEYSHI